jgi:hypothetical protein
MSTTQRVDLIKTLKCITLCRAIYREHQDRTGQREPPLTPKAFPLPRAIVAALYDHHVDIERCTIGASSEINNTVEGERAGHCGEESLTTREAGDRSY